MKLSLKELNDLYLCVSIVSRSMFCYDKDLEGLSDKLIKEINEYEESNWIEELDDNVVNNIGVF